jgi:type III secretion protein J
MRADQRGRAGAARATGVAIAALLLWGCTVPVANGLEESDANRIVLALDRANVDGTKEADPSAEGKFCVVVGRDDAARALMAMRAEELPRPRTAGVLEALGKGALVPSEAAEHAQFVAGLAGDLERSLEGVDGVLSARVHLNVPSPQPLRDAPPAKTTASVLLEHRGSTPPLSTDAVQRLVAGGVPGLAPTDVAVLAVPRPAPAAIGESQLAHLGPIAVARGSARLLTGILAGLMLLVVIFSSATALLFWRGKRAAEQATK